MRLLPKNYSLFDDFEDFFDGFNRIPMPDLMKTDVHEADDKYTLDVELPGYSKEDVTCELKNGYLTVSGKHETSDDEKDKKGNLIRHERSFGSCSRSFYVGNAVKQEDIKASFANGILAITVMKKDAKEVETANRIAIE